MRYVYGFMRAAEAPDRLDGGVSGAVVEPVTEGRLAALASAVAQEIVPRRADLLAHADILQRAHDAGTVLPLRFGVLMPGDDEVRAELASRADELERMLEQLDGRLEMSVSALYREEVVLREIVEERPEVARAQAAMRDKPPAATHFERIRLGELVAGAVEAKREADSSDILRELAPHAVAVADEDLLHEQMVVNAAFLVERDRLAEFDAAVEQASRRRAERMQFKLLGPRPPHSFVGAS